jgi:hypothetical protein
MNIILVKSVPSGDFEEVSIHMTDWHQRFVRLIQERKPIKYDVYTMPTLSKDIQDELSKQSYCHLILESDKDQHFLAPMSGTTRHE